MKRKILSVVLVCALVISMLAPINTIKAEAVKDEWNVEKYGDVLDIGTKLRHLEKDEEYRAKMDKRIKEMASKINFDEEEGLGESDGDSGFTFEGAKKTFLGYDSVEGSYLKTYTLRSIGENVEVWVADELGFFGLDDDGNDIEDPYGRDAYVITQEQVDRMRDVFDGTIYPKDTDFFGIPNSHTGENAQFTQWFGFDVEGNLADEFNYTPESYIPEGFEVKERVMILVDNIRDEQYYDPEYPFFIAGFYSPTVQDYIDRNIINLDAKDWDDRLERTFFGTAAHEFQHLIHDDNDPSEETWINEGMSDFAEYLCFEEHPMGHVNFFLEHPENSLVEWDEHYAAETGPETLSDYGQAYLMQLYLLDQYGKDFVRALATNELQGIESVNEVLDEFNTGIDFEELFRRFTIAVAIDSPQPGNNIYNFDSIDLNVNYETALEFDKDGVPAWGADYKVLEDAKKIRNVIFDGIEFMPTPWKIVEDHPLRSGEKVIWGNNGHGLDNQIVIEADLTNVDKATLIFNTYIDIEPGWDAGMVQVSTDNGETWTSLTNEYTIDKDEFPYNAQAPEVYNNLPGLSINHEQWEDWQKIEFDLTPYAGDKVFVKFRYMTDAAYNDTGWFIDDIEIPEIGYKNDCNSLDKFMSIDAMKEVYVDYAVTFINEKFMGNGKKAHYKVLNIDPFNITEKDAEQLKGFFNTGTNYMVIWYAAPVGKKGTVDFSYEIMTQDEFSKDKKNK